MPSAERGMAQWEKRVCCEERVGILSWESRGTNSHNWLRTLLFKPFRWLFRDENVAKNRDVIDAVSIMILVAVMQGPITER